MRESRFRCCIFNDGSKSVFKTLIAYQQIGRYVENRSNPKSSILYIVMCIISHYVRARDGLRRKITVSNPNILLYIYCQQYIVWCPNMHSMHGYYNIKFILLLFFFLFFFFLSPKSRGRRRDSNN